MLKRFLFYGILNVTDIMFYKFLTVTLILFAMFIVFYKQNTSLGIFKNFDKDYLKEAFIFGMATFLPSSLKYSNASPPQHILFILK